MTVLFHRISFVGNLLFVQHRIDHGSLTWRRENNDSNISIIISFHRGFCSIATSSKHRIYHSHSHKRLTFFISHCPLSNEALFFLSDIIEIHSWLQFTECYAVWVYITNSGFIHGEKYLISKYSHLQLSLISNAIEQYHSRSQWIDCVEKLIRHDDTFVPFHSLHSFHIQHILDSFSW